MDITTQTYALYRHVKHEYTSMQEVGPNYDDDDRYVRISDPVTIEFTPRDESIVQECMIRSTLEELERTIRDHDERVESLNDKLFELRALVAPSTVTEFAA